MDGEPLEGILHQPKRVALLVYLTVARPDGFHRRDSILALFWPELDQKRSRNALNKSLHFLRKRLHHATIESRGNEEIGVDRSRLWCDAVALREAREDGRWEEIVELYRGPFLEGFHLSEAEEFVFWLDRTREQFALDYANALRDLARRARDAHDPRAAARWWRKLVEHDPFHSAAVVGLMEALEAIGERGTALREAEEHARRLHEELGAEPDPAVDEVAERLRAEPHRADLSEDRHAAHNLPAQPTPLVGREEELERVCDLMADTDIRLLTLSGPGGAGKTRLAIRAAEELLDRFPGGVYLVSLGPLKDAGLVGVTIARTLGINVDGAQGVVEGLGESLARRRCLLLLDSFERVLPAANLVAELLRGTERLCILVTSRTVLQLQGEHILPVPSLSVPEDPAGVSLEAALEHDAVRLFVQRAKAVKPDFEPTSRNIVAISEICRRLDGLPLAIELAAARIKLFGPAAILERLSDRFSLLTGGSRDLPERQQTLRRTFDWSYDLLEEPERQLFHGLCVFVGGCSLEAVREVCYASEEERERSVDDLAALVDHSLVRQTETRDGEPWYAMLETIREYGWRLVLDEGDPATLRRRHAEYYLELAERAETGLMEERQAVWLDRLEREHGNVQAVLDWALEWGEVEMAVRLGSALWWFWWTRGHFAEMRWRLDQALARRRSLPPSLQANILVASGALASVEGDQERALQLFQEAFAVEREHLGKREVVRVLRSLAFALSREGEHGRARELLRESLSLAEELESATDVAAALRGLGKMCLHERRYDRAEELYEKALDRGREHGDPQSQAWALAGLGEVARHREDMSRASRLVEEGLEICRDLDSKPGIAYLLLAAAHIARYDGELERARSLYREALFMLRELKNRRRIALAVLGIVALDVREARFSRAVLLYGAIEPLLASLGVEIAPIDRDEQDRARAAVRGALDEAEIEALTVRGHGMSLDEAVEVALEDTADG